MPELPEVETIARELRPLVLGARMTGFWTDWPKAIKHPDPDAFYEAWLDALAGVGLLLVFAYAISWIMAWVGMLVPSPEVVNNASFVIIFPLTFVANTFVPLDTLPGPLRVFAEWNPVSAVTQAARELFGNPDPNPAAVPSDAWSLQHPQLYTLIWAVAVVAVFAPLANAQYKRATSR